MILVKILKRGKSFKGTSEYQSHDKRTDPSQPHPTTSNRVMAHGTINLATDDPELAWKMMAATYKTSGYLKKKSGISNRGRKTTKPVFRFIIA